MPLIDELYPSKFTEPEHLNELFPRGTVLTVEKVEQREDRKAERYLVIYFKELLKPLPLNKTNAEEIARISGSRDTDEWAGVEILGFCIPFEVREGNGPATYKTAFRVSQPKRGDKPLLKHKSDLVVLIGIQRQEERRLAAQKQSKAELPGTSGIGIDRAVKMMYLLKQRGKDWQFVVDHFTNSLKMGEQIAGIAKPPDLPDSMAALIGGIVKSFPITTQVDPTEHEAECRALWTPSIKGEVIDPKTGEVIDMTDIPF